MIPWRTPSQRHSPKFVSPTQIKREVFHPSHSVRWQGHWFSPALDPTSHFSRWLALAQGVFPLICRLSAPGAGLPPYLCPRLATSLIAPILLYGADLFTPSLGTTTRLDTFWHHVQRWTTNRFSATPTGILSLESCLPQISHLVTYRQRLTGLRVVCSPPSVNPVTASLHPSFASLSVYWAPDSLRAITRGLSSLYLPLNWKMPCPVPPLRNHLPVDAVAHRTIPVALGLSRMPMINSHPVWPTPTLPLLSLMDNTYSALTQRGREKLLAEWASLVPTPGYYLHPPALSPRPFMRLGNFVAGRIHQIRAGKSYLTAHPTWTSPDAATTCPGCGLDPETLVHAILSCPSRQDSRLHLLHCVTEVGTKAPLSTFLPMLKRLATFIGVTSTGFPPSLIAPTTPPSSPTVSLSPPCVPPAVFCIFSLAEVSGRWASFLYLM